MDIPSELIKAERLIAAGQLEEAKTVLRGILAQDKRNAAAWYLVAQSVADPRAKAEALRRTLLTDPDHLRAKREFEAMDGLAILQPPSMAKPTPAAPDMPPNKVLEDAAPKRGLPLVPLLISGGMVLVVLIGLVLVASRPSNSPTPTVLVLAASASPIVPVVVQTMPTAPPTTTATVIPSTPTSIPNELPTAGDALAQTATTIQQNIAATGTGLAQAAGNRTQIAALTQTATQQGALGATVVAQQTAMAALSALPGTLIVLDNNTHHITASNIQFVTVNGWLSPDGNHVAYTKITSIGLFLANQDGSGEQPVTGLPDDYKNENAFAWSPDGHWLSVSLASGLYLVSVQDRVAHALLLSGTVAWSPDHQHVAVLGYVVNSTVTGQTSLYIIDLGHLDAPPLHITLPKPVTVNQSGAPVFELAGWFGDDQHILFTKSVRGSTEVEGSITLLVLDLKTQAQRALRMFPITEISLLDELTIAPDGQHLAVFGYVENVAFPNRLIIRLLDANGHDLKVLPVTLANTDFAWSPDSKRLAISSTNGMGYDTNIDQWFQFDDLSLHQVLPGAKGLAGGLWSPDSRSLVICQFTQRDGLKVTAGKLLLIPMAAGSTPVTLFDQYVCPSMWVP